MMYLTHPWRCAIVGLLLANESISARAANCAYTPTTPTELTFVANLGGSITVGRDVALGSQIYQAAFSGGARPTLSCPAGAYTLTRSYITPPGVPSGFVDGARGQIYLTSVPGIGYAASYLGNGLPYATQQLFSRDTIYSATTVLDISFFKIGDVAPGTIRAVDLPEVEQVMTGDASVRANLWRFVGTLDIVASTCTTPDVTVDLGDHQLTELNGVDTATNWIDVPVRLQDCPGYFGSYRRDVTDDSGFRTAAANANQLRYLVDSTTAIIDAGRSIMALRNAGAPGTATGMGIQVALANETPVVFGRLRASGLSLTDVSGTSYTIPLKARYIQTSPDVAPGVADGQATVTLIYL